VSFELVLERKTSCNTYILRSERVILFEIGLFSSAGETQVSLDENHVFPKEEHLAHCFPGQIELVFGRNTSSKSEFSRWRKALLSIFVCSVKEK
jgi:hypothetical protein